MSNDSSAMDVLRQRLEKAAQLHPDSRTLAEYRAPDWIVSAEREALSAARKIVSPHSDIQNQFSSKVVRLHWHLPSGSVPDKTRRGIAFPGPTAARKGAHELRSVARKLDLQLLLIGSDLEGNEFWHGIRATKGERRDMQGAAAVAQPALLEDNPRLLLNAIAMDVPVIATPACGLAEFSRVIQVPYGDENTLAEAISEQLRLHASASEGKSNSVLA